MILWADNGGAIMIEVEIPSDIKEYEPKIIGPITKRIAICLIGIAATSLIGYSILNQIFDNSLRIFIPLIFDVPWALIAAYKPYGMKFEKYFVSQLYTTIIPPKHRKYTIENIYEKFEQEIITEETPKVIRQVQKLYQRVKEEKRDEFIFQCKKGCEKKRNNKKTKPKHSTENNSLCSCF